MPFLRLTGDSGAILLSAGEEGMSLHIYIAHTGEHFLADPVSFASYVRVVGVQSSLLRALGYPLFGANMVSLVRTLFDHGLPAMPPFRPKGKS